MASPVAASSIASKIATEALQCRTESELPQKKCPTLITPSYSQQYPPPPPFNSRDIYYRIHVHSTKNLICMRGGTRNKILVIGDCAGFCIGVRSGIIAAGACNGRFLESSTRTRETRPHPDPNRERKTHSSV